MLKKVFSPVVGTITGSILGILVIKTLLPMFIRSQIGEYNFNIVPMRIVVLIICVVLDLAIVYHFFQKVPSISITTIIFSCVSKAQILLNIGEKNIATPEMNSFIIMILMFLFGATISFVYRRSYNKMIKKKIEGLCMKHAQIDILKNPITAVTQEVKQPSIWMVFDDDYIEKIKDLLKTYSGFISSQQDKDRYNNEVNDLKFEISAWYRLWVTGVLAFAASVCVYCMGFQAVPIITP